MFNFVDDIRQLWNQLFPTGRAYRTPVGSFKEKLRNGISNSLKQTADDSYSVLYSILPDNENFTEEMATRWEGLLGLITNPSVPLADRKQAIIRKMNHPGNILARQSRDYIESQLQLAGFDVYVYENIPAQNPGTFFGPGLSGIAEHSDMVEHMETGMEHGSLLLWNDVVANSINWEEDQYFDIGQNLKCTFFICGSMTGVFADVTQERRIELRQLILRLKPTQAIAYLGINYT